MSLDTDEALMRPWWERNVEYSDWSFFSGVEYRKRYLYAASYASMQTFNRCLLLSLGQHEFPLMPDLAQGT